MELAKRRIDLIHKRENLTVEETRSRSKTLTGFIREAWHIVHPFEEYIGNWHIDLICRHLEAITNGEFLEAGYSNRLRINVPPGTMKSLLINVFWTAWEWGPRGLPWIKNISTSYREDFCTRDARRTRDLILSDWYQKHWPLKLVRTGEKDFENEKGGSYKAMPFGSLTGGRAHRVKVDDPHSVDTAESEPDRISAIRRFREALPTRMIDPKKSAIVLIMQRLHADDLSGVVDQLQLGYINLILPMEFESDHRCKTPFGQDPRKKDGELLFPQRFDREVVERDKIPLGDYGVSGQFQQRPVPREGGLFKREWFKFVDTLPPGCRFVRGWDLAATKHKKKLGLKQAWTAGVKLAIDSKKHLYVVHCARVKADPAGVEEFIDTISEQDEPGCAQDLPRDPGQAGKSQVFYLTTALQGRIVHNSLESGSKEDRAGPFASQARVGNVSLLRGDWNNAYLAEIEMFPNSSTKDQVDATSRAHARLVPKTKSGKVPHGGEIVAAEVY